ncbi:hypothetical protein GCM10009756_14790 [Pseudokineococcus marinus]
MVQGHEPGPAGAHDGDVDALGRDVGRPVAHPTIVAHARAAHAQRRPGRGTPPSPRPPVRSAARARRARQASQTSPSRSTCAFSRMALT